MKKALIIFVRNPVLGKVKTRLAKTIGDAKALDVYKQLLAYTISITSDLDCDKFVYYSDSVDNADGWNDNVYQKRLQQGDNLGTRMKNAFKELFNMGYDQVAIIGSDCYQLTSPIIENAFTHLQNVEAVIGPSEDGGYYLLGLKNMFEPLFENKCWGTDRVRHDTASDLEAAHLSYLLLATLRDIDVEADLPVEYRRNFL